MDKRLNQSFVYSAKNSSVSLPFTSPITLCLALPKYCHILLYFTNSYYYIVDLIDEDVVASF